MNHPTGQIRRAYTEYENSYNSNINQQEVIAATKIQAGYRGYRTRKQYGRLNSDTNQARSAYRNTYQLSLPNGNTRNPSVNYINRNPKSNPHKNTISHDPVKAATVIQAGYRGYKIRKSLSTDIHNFGQLRLSSKFPNTRANTTSSPTSYKDDLATTRVQATYGEYATRTYMQTSYELNRSQPSSIDPEQAATKIQATFRGYKTRQTLPK